MLFLHEAKRLRDPLWLSPRKLCDISLAVYGLDPSAPRLRTSGSWLLFPTLLADGRSACQASLSSLLISISIFDGFGGRHVVLCTQIFLIFHRHRRTVSVKVGESSLLLIHPTFYFSLSQSILLSGASSVSYSESPSNLTHPVLSCEYSFTLHFAFDKIIYTFSRCCVHWKLSHSQYIYTHHARTRKPLILPTLSLSFFLTVRRTLCSTNTPHNPCLYLRIKLITQYGEQSEAENLIARKRGLLNVTSQLWILVCIVCSGQ